MTNHCPGCHCRETADEHATVQPATSTAWARRQALDAAKQAVHRAKEARKRPTEETK